MKLKVTEKKVETKTTFSLIFEKPEDFNFYPGQYLDYELNNDTRAFTIAASPTENFLMLTTKKGISEFKKALEKLNPGDEIQISHPAGTFILDETEPTVFLAGGVGITPFRSMLKYAVDKNLKMPIKLIYLNSDDNFTFKQDLDIWQKQLKHLKIYYINTSKQNRLDKETLKSYLLNLKSIFYLAGPPKMIGSFEKMLSDLGVDEVNIRTDSFDGYE